MWIENMWLGSEEVVITFQYGTFHVWRECDYDPQEVFTGSYEECKRYAKELWVAYEESRF